MAKSKNRRGNGKVVRSSVTKRMRAMAQADIKDLIVCSAVDLVELDGSATGVMQPRSVVISRKLRDKVKMTKLQAVALSEEPWRWNIYTAIVCRKQNGEVYLWKEDNIFTVDLVRLREMNDYVSETLCDRWLECNPLHRLTMVWVAAPYDMGDVPLEAILAPLHYYQILGKTLTEYEQANPEHVVLSYRATTLADFSVWYISQGRYKKELALKRDIAFSFTPTGTKMKAGELVAFREKLQNFGRLGNAFNPRATVQSFATLGDYKVTMTGVEYSCLMTALQSVPPCLNCVVDVLFEDGQDQHIEFSYGNEVLGW